MTRSVPLSIFFAALAMGGFVSNAAAGSGTTGNVNLLLGQKLLGVNSIEDGQPSVALDVMWGAHNWPILLNAYASGSWGKGENAIDDMVSETSYETGIGVARLWNVRAFHPHVGAGVARVWKRTHIASDLETYERTLEEADTRLWIAAGGLWRFASGLSLGAALRFSELGHTDASLGGAHIGFTLGWGWPAVP